MKLSLNSFQGELPVVADRLLPDNAASACMNGRYEGGSLVPEREVYDRVSVVIPGGAGGFQLTDETTIQNAFNNPPAPGSNLSIIAQDSWLITIPTTGDIIRGPLASDAYNRWYIARQGSAPKVRYTKDGATGEKGLAVNPPVLSYSFEIGYADSPASQRFGGGISQRPEGLALVRARQDEYQGSARWYGTEFDITAKPEQLKASLEADEIPYESVFSTYVLTVVSILGEESKISSPSRVVERLESDSIVLGVILQFGDAIFDDPQIEKVNVYRSDGSGSFGYVGSLSRAEYDVQLGESATRLATNSFDVVLWSNGFTAFFVDTVPSSKLGESNITADWDQPDTSMASITNVGAGLLAGHFDGTVCFCEPYYPHAWPVEYQYNFADDKADVEVMGIVATAGFILVTTNSRPVLMFGSEPGAMSQQVVDIVAPNVSRRGLVDMGDYALYPTHDGLMMVSSGSARLVTKGVFSKEQWQALNPAGFVAFRYNESYLCFSGGVAFIFNAETGYFPIDPWAQLGAVTVLDGYYNPASDSFWILLIEDDVLTRIVKFGAGDLAELSWRSKEFQIPGGLAFSSARVEGDEDVQFILTGDGGYSYSATITSDAPFRLPPGRPRTLQLELRSSGRIDAVAVATSMQELY
tara:strand:- start:1414 stop:3333 length:1920 start_codon:yes stop_codon:yes gene_type:complete